MRRPFLNTEMSECRIIIGDAVQELGRLPAESVHCVVTSPPYWGLRDYGVDGQIGLEKSPAEYVEKMVCVFREVRRVLRSDGTLWLNLGDTYAGGGLGGGGGFANDGIRMAAEPGTDKNRAGRVGSRLVGFGLRRKNLAGMPWRVALALQEDGWNLRSDIIWHKRNPMPESIKDRPTVSHEYLFLFSKSARYFYDWFAVREDVTGTANARSAKADQFPGEALRDGNRRRLPGVNPKAKLAGANSRAYVDRDFSHQWRIKQNPSYSLAISGLVSKRNKRTVWTLSTAPFSGAHFATFPPGLVNPCILAGTGEKGCCGECGAPRLRITKKGKADLAHQRACGGDINGRYDGKATKHYEVNGAENASEVKARILRGMKETITTGWMPGCDCGEPSSPCVVLDPFAGSGTVGMVAGGLGRDAILIELNGDYKRLIEQRTKLQHSILT